MKSTKFPYGVYYCRADGLWEACIKLEHSQTGSLEHIGYFELERDAAEAFNAVAKLYGMPVNSAAISGNFKSIAESFRMVQDQIVQMREERSAEALLRASKKAKIDRELGEFLPDAKVKKEGKSASSSSTKTSSSSSSSSSSSLSSSSSSAASGKAGSAKDVVAQPLFVGEAVKLLFDDNWEPAVIDRETMGGIKLNFTDTHTSTLVPFDEVHTRIRRVRNSHTGTNGRSNSISKLDLPASSCVGMVVQSSSIGGFSSNRFVRTAYNNVGPSFDAPPPPGSNFSSCNFSATTATRAGKMGSATGNPAGETTVIVEELREQKQLNEGLRKQILAMQRSTTQVDTALQKAQRDLEGKGSKLAAAQAQITSQKSDFASYKKQQESARKDFMSERDAQAKKIRDLKANIDGLKSKHYADTNEQRTKARQVKDELRSALDALESERATLKEDLDQATTTGQVAAKRLEASRFQNKWLRQRLYEFETPAKTAAAASTAGIIDAPETVPPLQTCPICLDFLPADPSLAMKATVPESGNRNGGKKSSSSSSSSSASSPPSSTCEEATTVILQCGHRICSECVDGLAANGLDAHEARSTRRELGIPCPLCRRCVRVRHPGHA